MAPGHQLALQGHVVLNDVRPAQQLGAVVRIGVPQLPPGLVKEAVVVGGEGVVQGQAGVLEVRRVRPARQLRRQLRQAEVLLQVLGKFRRSQGLPVKPEHPGAARVLGVIAPPLGTQLIEKGEQAGPGQQPLRVQLRQPGTVELGQEGQGPGLHRIVVKGLRLKHRPHKAGGHIRPAAEFAAPRRQGLPGLDKPGLNPVPAQGW